MRKYRTLDETIGFLGRLRRDVRGNTLALMAAMLIPLAALSGSAVDLGRLYTVKTRLQQACDAGVLAGRKMMVDPSSSTLDDTATQAAQTFFANNFHAGWFKTSSVVFTPTKSGDSQVDGTATAVVPMTVMTMFGVSSRTVSVTCEARYDVADADIMFVLDTTGSMACTTADDPCGAPAASYTRPDGTTGYYDVEESGSKLSGLRAAVLSFYDTLVATADPSTHIRYGFVTYTSTVNVGYLLPSSALVTKWKYQTRTPTDANNGTATNTVYTGDTQTSCNARTSRNPATGYTSSGTATVYTASWSSSTSKCTVTAQPVKVVWTYGQAAYDVSQYVAGNVVVDPTKIGNVNSQKWQGCIEERNTAVGANSYDINNLPDDLDPDKAPVADVDANGLPTSSDTRWRPMWPEVIYYRGSSLASFQDTNPDNSPQNYDNSRYQNVNGASYLKAGYITCGKPAQRLTTMTRTDVSNFVNATDFRAIGGTYHDTGMIWGTRLISPTGIFASDTAAWPGRQAPNRFIVFMTDGQMSPNQSIYGMYGLEQYDQRVTGGSFSNDTAYHNARFVAECAAAKARNITVFVVGFGQTLNSQLKACASPGQAYYASDNAALKTAFQKIAQQVAMLRISK
jgi:Flp pilus assembly protein TadG